MSCRSESVESGQQNKSARRRGQRPVLIAPCDTKLIKQLEATCCADGVTLPMAMLATFQVLLYRYTAAEQIGLRQLTKTNNELGIPTAVDDDEPLFRFSDELTFESLLQGIRDHVDGAGEQRGSSSADLAVVLYPNAGMPHSDPMVALFRTSNADGNPVLEPNGNVDFALCVTKMSSGWSCQFECEESCFDAEALVRLNGHFQTLLAAIANDQRQCVSRLPLLTDAEREKLLVEWNTDSESSEGGCFRQQLFEEQVDRAPDALAVIVPETPIVHRATSEGPGPRVAASPVSLTYRELEQRANQLANYLIKQGVGPEISVGLSMEPSPELVIATLAVTKAGGVCVPLDLTYPVEQLVYIIKDAQVVLLLTQERYAEFLPDAGIPLLCVDTEWESVLSAESQQRPRNRLLINNSATVFYTSGSTGDPKAVVALHGKSLLRPQRKAGQPQSRHLMKAGIGLTPFQAEMFIPLTTGGMIVIAPPEIRLDSRRIVDFMAEHRINMTNFVPSMLRQILNTPGVERCTALNRVICFGEHLSVEMRDDFLTRLDATLEIMYGTTEAPGATTVDLTRSDIGISDTIGRRHKHQRIYILDAHQQPVPCGVAGELYVGGRISRGYLNRPDLTAERFVPDPFSKSGGDVLYRTGDRVRYLADGFVQFLGRGDEQTKIRGYRVETGHVAEVLGRHPLVTATVVVPRKDRLGTNQLIAYVATSGEPAFEIGQLRRYLENKLPRFMIPARFVVLDKLPLGPSGKVNRRALPDLDYSRPKVDSEFVASRNGTEEELATIWSEILGVDSIGVHDNFFELGGDSILALEILGRIDQKWGRKIPLALLFQQGTIAHCAKLVSDCSSNTNSKLEIAEVVALRQNGQGRPLFVMPGITGETVISTAIVESIDSPMFGVQPCLEPEFIDHFRDFRHTAVILADTLQAYQPTGSYALMGFSYGGMMAYEVASVLAARGAQIDLLVVIDIGPGMRGQQINFAGRLKKKCRIAVNFPSWCLEEWKRFNHSSFFDRLLRFTRKTWRQIMLSASASAEFSDIWDETILPVQNRELMRIVYAACRDYQPESYSGQVDLIVAKTQGLMHGLPPDRGWSRFVEQLEIHAVSGDHASILEHPNVDKMVDIINRLLSERADSPPIDDESWR